MKEQIIQFPDNLEVKEIKDGKIILVEKEGKLTYKNIAKKLFPNNKVHYYLNSYGEIDSITTSEINYHYENNSTSKKQVKKLLAINKLMNVAKWLNGGWQPDWNNRDEYKYYIAIHKDTIEVHSITVWTCLDVYFKSKELAEQAVEILGEDVIRLAVCTDY